MTEKEVRDSLEERGVNLLITEPFYGHILSGIIKVIVAPESQRKTINIESLSMTTIKLSIRADRWEKLSKENRKKSLKKQIMHYIFMHPWSDRPKDIGLFYTSCDISANKYALDTETLNPCNFDDLFRHHSVPYEKEDWMSIYNSILNLRNKLEDTLSGPEKEFYSLLALKGEFWNKDQLTEAIFYLPRTSSGSMNFSDVADMLRSLLSMGAEPDAISQAIKDMAQETEDPWKSVGEGTSDLGAKEIIKNALNDAKMRGDIPGEMQSFVDAFLTPPKIDWKSEVRKFTSLTGNIQAKTTMTRRSKRTGTFPATRIVKTQKIAIIADSSGSVSDDEFVAFFSEMRGLLKENCIIIFIQADAQVDQVDTYKKNLPDELKINREGYGGTAFGPALRFVRDQGMDSKFDKIGKVDGVIYMTDGYANAPDHEDYPSGTKMMWITTRKPVNKMESEGFLGKIVLLEVEEML